MDQFAKMQGVNPATVSNRSQAPVHNALEAQDKYLASLGSIIDELHSRLYPILTQMPPTDGKARGEMPTSSTVSGVINANNDKLDYAINYIRDIMSRLEI